MLSKAKLRALDLSAIDRQSLSGEEWAAVQREAVRRAHIERANHLTNLLRWLLSRSLDRKRGFADESWARARSR
jgi:hypothetical protein